MNRTDLVRDAGIQKFMPAFLRPYARLMRLDRPIGIWLLLWPCFWSLLLASGDGFPALSLFILFAAGAVVMRGAGCVVNDLFDRKLDAKIERTAGRPLPAGEVSVGRAVAFLAVLLAIGAVILAQFNSFTVVLGLMSLPLVFFYPLAKRVTWWPQLVLGLTFNWGALMGWSAVYGEVGLPCVLLYCAGVFWTLAYDTIYAHQDKRDDAIVGVKSLALYLGARARLWIAGFFIAFFLFLMMAAGQVGMPPVFYYVLFFAQLQVVWQIGGWRQEDPDDCLRRFKSNHLLGALVFFALFAGRVG